MNNDLEDNGESVENIGPSMYINNKIFHGIVHASIKRK